MNDDIEELKRDYQAIKAPPHLATRIHASVAGSRTRSGWWMPAAMACTAIIALVLMLPDTTITGPDVIERSAQPSMSTLAALRPTKPSVPTPGLSQIKSVSVPLMPPRPTTVITPQPQGNNPSNSLRNNQFENRALKEKDNVYI
jgi:hypothetical protein